MTTTQPTIEHTYPVDTIFKLRDVLAAELGELSPGTRTTAEALISLGIINLPGLAKHADALAAEELHGQTCTNSSCDGPRNHVHSDLCGPLCDCGKGN